MNISENTQDVLFSYYNSRISNHLIYNRKDAAKMEAFEWLKEYEKPLCITVPWNWKIAKKQIAAYYFGKNHSIQLDYFSDVLMGIEFVKSHPEVNVRCSYHKYDTACYSESHRINSDNLDWLLYVKSIMNEKDIIDIFIECSTPSTTCFRRFSLQYNEDVSYEMGFGQAMYVFETERGHHDIAASRIIDNNWKMEDATDPILTKYLKQLISTHNEYLSIKTQCICYYLGIPQISLEGYYDTAYPVEKPIIVDIDLPFDRAFF